MSLVERKDSNSIDKVRLVGQFSAAQLLGGRVSPRTGIAEPYLYKFLGSRDLKILEVNIKDSSEIWVVGFPVTGMELNALLHFAAPSRFFASAYGMDTDDLLKDWVELYKPERVELLKKHIEKYVGAENWAHFEKIKDLVWGIIKRDYEREELGQKNLSDTVTPVARLLRNKDGKLSWNFEDIPYQLHEVPVLGPDLIAAFSPEITERWPKRLGHATVDQDMGTTQILPLTLMRKSDLLLSLLVKQIVGVVETGQIPVIPN